MGGFRKAAKMTGKNEIGQLREQLALCRRLVPRLMEGDLRNTIEYYASELEVRLWLLLVSDETLQPSPW